MSSSAKLQPGPDVCVIGAEIRYEHIGGTWLISQSEEQISALPQMTFNTSKHCSAISDFPMPDEFPVHPPAKNIEAYVESYAKNFNLLPHVEFSTSVDHVERDEDNNKWTIFTHNTKAGSLEHRSFSRIVVATGILNVKNMPTIEEIDKFAGDAIHSRQFKGASKYKGKNVLVVGFGSTGADTTSFLSKGGANKVYLSHRGRVYLLPRRVRGKAFDHIMTRRLTMCVRVLASIWSRDFAALMSKGFQSMRAQEFAWLNRHSSGQAVILPLQQMR